MLRVSILVALVALALPVAAQESPAARALSGEDRRLLEGGETIVEVTTEGRSNRAELVSLITGEPGDVFAVIADFESYETWVDDQAESVVLERDGDTWLLQGETNVPVFPNRHYRLRDTRSERVVNGETVYVDEWELVEEYGNMDENTGFWWVQRYDAQRTIVRMVLFADLGMPLPQSIINWGTRRALPNLADGIQEQHDLRNP